MLKRWCFLWMIKINYTERRKKNWKITEKCLSFLVLRQRELCRVFDPRGSDKIDISDKFSANLHLIVRMDDKLRLAISIDKTFIVIVEIHLKTVLRKTYHVSISYRSVTWKISDFYLTLSINSISPLYGVSG